MERLIKVISRLCSPRRNHYSRYCATTRRIITAIIPTPRRSGYIERNSERRASNPRLNGKRPFLTPEERTYTYIHVRAPPGACLVTFLETAYLANVRNIIYAIRMHACMCIFSVERHPERSQPGNAGNNASLKRIANDRREKNHYIYIIKNIEENNWKLNNINEKYINIFLLRGIRNNNISY